MPLTEAELAELDRLLLMPPDDFARTDPIGWMEATLGIPRDTVEWGALYAREGVAHQWDGTPDPLATIVTALFAGRDVGVESATGTGKTYLAAAIALCFLVAYPDALVVTTAPKEDQLTAQLWKEIGRHWPRFSARYPMASTVQLRVRLKEGAGEQETWAILGYACGVEAGQESATRAQGFHAAHMLIVTEETPGIDAAIMAAFANTSVGAHNVRLALGNPDNQLDSLHTFCTEPGVVHVRISGYDHPNVVLGRDVIPGAVTPKSLERMRAKWGTGTPMYESRARGVSPSESVHSLIKLEWCKAAAARAKADAALDVPVLRAGPKAIGVDVAQSENGDFACIARFSGAVCVETEEAPCNNATLLGRNVATEAKQNGVNPMAVGVDAIGVGAATVNELRERLGPIQALNSGGSPVDGAQKAADGTPRDWMPDANEHKNLRAQMWWQLREDLRLGVIGLPDDPDLFKQLIMPHYKIQGGVVVVESKLDIRKRLGRSPDTADAVVYGNWVRPRAKVKVPLEHAKADDRALPLDPKTLRPVTPVDPQRELEKVLHGGQTAHRPTGHRVPHRNWGR